MGNMNSRNIFDSTVASMFSNPKYQNSYLFYAHLVGQCSIKIKPELPAPAGISYTHDHFNLYINPTFFDKYTLDQRLAILKHEMLHILNNHLSRRTESTNPNTKVERNMFVWNLATDCAINQLIDDNDLPGDGITPESLKNKMGITVQKNLSAEYYYDEIINQNDSHDDDGNGMDTHDTWEESVGDRDLQTDLTKKMIEYAHDQTIKSAGTIPKQYSKYLDMFTRKNEVNWRYVLRKIIGNKRVNKRQTIMRQDRRFPNREELRGKIKDRTFDLLVVIDVSGSMTNDGILSTLSEVQNICKLTKTSLMMIQVDTHAHDPQHLSTSTKIFTRLGQGGTYLSNALKKADEHKLNYDGVIVLTDGELFDSDIEEFHKINKKVIFLIENQGTANNRLNVGKLRSFKLKF